MREAVLRAAAALLVLVGCTGRSPAQNEAETGRLSVAAFGAKGDGKTDDTAAFQQALDACFEAGGGAVSVPAGTYRIEGNLVIRENVALVGTFQSAPHAHARPGDKPTGSRLQAVAGRGREDGAPFVHLDGINATLRGFVIEYPEWRPTDVPPVPYPPTVLGGHHPNMAVLDCMFLNSYEAIRLVGSGRHLIRNVTGYPIKRGISVDFIMDVGRIENVHFWPFGYRYDPNDPYCRWINTNGVAIELGKTDWQIVQNCFSFGYGVGFRFTPGSPQPGSRWAAGPCGKLIGCGVDCSQTPVLAECVNGHMLIGEGEFVGRWGGRGVVAVDVRDGTRGRISFSNCSFWGPIDHIARMDAPEGILSMIGCHFRKWSAEDGAIHIQRGRAILNGNSFDVESARHVVVGEEAGSVVAVGNLAFPGFGVSAPPNADLLLEANSVDKMAWPEGARRHYRIDVGGRGDSRYLANWHAQETAEATGREAARWSKEDSWIRLPVVAGVPYEVTIRATVPGQALSEDAGVYLGDTRLTKITRSGPVLPTVRLPAQQEEVVQLRLRAAGWQPKPKAKAGDGDARTLGIRGHSIEVAAEGSQDSPLFDANAGRWLANTAEAPSSEGTESQPASR